MKGANRVLYLALLHVVFAMKTANSFGMAILFLLNMPDKKLGYYAIQGWIVI